MNKSTPYCAYCLHQLRSQGGPGRHGHVKPSRHVFHSPLCRPCYLFVHTQPHCVGYYAYE